MQTPDRQIHVRDPDHYSHAFCDGIELPMPEQATHKGRDFVLGHGQVNEAISGMAKMTRIKVLIPRQKRWASEAVQQGHDLLVFHPLSAHLLSTVAYGNPPV